MWRTSLHRGDARFQLLAGQAALAQHHEAGGAVEADALRVARHAGGSSRGCIRCRHGAAARAWGSQTGRSSGKRFGLTIKWLPHLAIEAQALALEAEKVADLWQ